MQEKGPFGPSRVMKTWNYELRLGSRNTGTTLLRCAQAMQAGGAAEVRVLTLFRVL